MIYPPAFPEDIDNTAEKEVYNALAKLPEDNFDIFYQKTFSGISKGESNDYEIDFLIIDKRQNRFNAVLVVEVKGGALSYSARENAWYQSGHKLIPGPDEQARKNKHNFLKRFRNLLNNVPIDWALWFPDGINKSGTFLPTNISSWKLMDHLSFQFCEETIMDIFDTIQSMHPLLSGEPIENYNNKLSKSLLRGLGIVRPLNIILKDYEEKFIFLEEMQKMFFENIYERQRIALSGGAGTGKTLLASSAAIDLANEGNKVLLLCFNRMLYLALKSTCVHENLDVSTFHTLAYNIVKKADPDWYDNQDISDSNFYEYEFPNKFFETIQSQNLQHSYDVLVIDEAQDFNEFWLETVFSLVKNNGKIILLFDDNQNIFNRKFKIPEEDTFLKTHLKYNFRNTKKIGEYVSEKTGINIYPKKTPTGIEVIEYNYLSLDDLTASIIQELSRLINTENLSCNDITILIEGSVNEHPFNEIDYLGQWKLEAWDVDKHREPNKLYFTSISRFKGLESQIVILIIDNNKDFWGDKRFYTQCTRAKSLLLVFVGK